MAVQGTIDPSRYLAPAMTPRHENVFFIGPYGRRINFASQQRRALNVVWALEAAGRIKPGDRVAVIGAGLAGVTAAVALAARKMHVFVYESRSAALRTQSATTHRFVHPTINFWPEEQLSPSTAFPFFDWASDDCDRIIEVLHKEWEELHKILEDKNLIQKYHTNTTVAELAPDAKGVKVIPAPPHEKHRTAVVRAVLVTTGFGTEKDLSEADVQSYWKTDPIEDDIRNTPINNFLVSGTGDGGLIDTLRLLHSKFDRGAFCLEIAQDLADVGPDLVEIETHIREQNLSPDAAARAYDEQYRNFLSARMPDGTKGRLKKSLIDRKDRHVRLVGELPHPYSINAAPIHKLMIAHALEAGVLEYVQGKVGARRAKDKTVTINMAERGDVAVDAEYMVVRHGAIPPLCPFIPEKEEREALRQRQDEARHWLDQDVVPQGYFDFEGWPKHNTTSFAFVQKRLARARRFAEEFVGAFADIGNDGGKRFFRLSDLQDLPLRADRVPDRLFGVHVAVDQPRKMRSRVGRKRP